MYRTRKGLIVANGPSSWRHGRGNGIKPRRAAQDLLIVATSRRGYRGAARLRQARLSSGSFSLFLRLPVVRYACTEQELVFFFLRRLTPKRTNGPKSLLVSPARTTPHCAYSRPPFQSALVCVHLVNLPNYPLLPILLSCTNEILFFLSLSPSPSLSPPSLWTTAFNRPGPHVVVTSLMHISFLIAYPIITEVSRCWSLISLSNGHYKRKIHQPPPLSLNLFSRSLTSSIALHTSAGGVCTDKNGPIAQLLTFV